jgi:hypothetical protein
MMGVSVVGQKVFVVLNCLNFLVFLCRVLEVVYVCFVESGGNKGTGKYGGVICDLLCCPKIIS